MGKVPTVVDDHADLDELAIVTSKEGDVGVIRADGELDANNADRLRGAVDELFAVGDPTVVLDLAGISFIDSSGLSVLIAAYKQANELGGSLTLRSPSAAVTRLLDVTGQSKRFLDPGN